MRELEFLGNEIVFIAKNESSSGFDSGEKKIKEAKILYVGKSCKLGYKEGDTILYEKTPLIVEREIYDQEYSVMSELGVICRVK